MSCSCSEVASTPQGPWWGPCCSHFPLLSWNLGPKGLSGFWSDLLRPLIKHLLCASPVLDPEPRVWAGCMSSAKSRAVCEICLLSSPWGQGLRLPCPRLCPVCQLPG